MLADKTAMTTAQKLALIRSNPPEKRTCVADSGGALPIPCDRLPHEEGYAHAVRLVLRKLGYDVVLFPVYCGYIIKPCDGNRARFAVYSAGGAFLQTCDTVEQCKAKIDNWLVGKD